MRLYLDADLAETVPDGTFGHARPSRHRPEAPQAWTRAEQDQHWADLCDAVGTPGRERPTPPAPDTAGPA